MSIGERITELRKKSGLSQGELASIMSVSRQAVSKWENDTSSPDTIRLIQLADVLNTEVEYLATGRMPVYEKPPEEIVFQKPEAPPREVIVEKIIERPVIQTKIKRVVRIKYRMEPITATLIGVCAFFAGLLVGLLL